MLPKRTFIHRKTNRQPLTREESDKAVRLARIMALAEVVFGDKEKAARWLRKAKRRFASRTPWPCSLQKPERAFRQRTSS